MGNDLETNERLRSAFFFHCFKKTQYKDITFQKKAYLCIKFSINLKSASNLNGNLNCSKELEHYAS